MTVKTYCVRPIHVTAITVMGENSSCIEARCLFFGVKSHNLLWNCPWYLCLILLCSIIYCIVHIGMIMLNMLVLTIKVTHCKCCFLRSRIPVHHVHLNLNIDILPLPKKALWQTFLFRTVSGNNFQQF